LGRFILAPGEILPRFPGLYVNIIPIGYKNPRNLRLGGILPDDEIIIPNFNPLPQTIREILNGIREIHEIIIHQGEHWRLYERVLATIERIRQSWITEALPPTVTAEINTTTVAAAAAPPNTLASTVFGWVTWGFGYIVPTTDPDPF